MYTGKNICEKCADKVNIQPYIELDDYLVIEESDNELAMIRKDTGEKKLLSVTGQSAHKGDSADRKGSSLFATLRGETTEKINFHNICGCGHFLYILRKETGGRGSMLQESLPSSETGFIMRVHRMRGFTEFRLPKAGMS